MPFSTADTIVAIATPPGRGGIGVVRLSGPEAPRVAGRLLARTEALPPRQATFGRVVDWRTPAPRPIDQVVATWFAAPHSYTGDDVVELSAHGSMVLLRQIVELAIDAGARLAEPGEFTFRAYLNGRLDLVQAEAVADLVDAVTPLQARAAMDQLEGTLTAAIAEIDSALFDLAARLEASLDFPEEGFHFVTRDETIGQLASLRDRVAALVEAGRAGRVMREGRTVVLAGLPNAGKSSLFNALAGAARAIVTDVAGTTRDLLTERVDVGGVPLTLVDTAGDRDARDAIEEEGVARARQARVVAALTLVVVDASAAVDASLRSLLGQVGGPRLVVLNKCDLPPATAPDEIVTGERAVSVSARTGAGLDELRAAIVERLTDRDDWRDPPAVTNVRHVALLGDASAALERAGHTLDAGASEEFVLAELAAARAALEQISGGRSADDLLRHIFGSFCIGK